MKATLIFFFSFLFLGMSFCQKDEIKVEFQKQTSYEYIQERDKGFTTILIPIVIRKKKDTVEHNYILNFLVDEKFSTYSNIHIAQEKLYLTKEEINRVDTSITKHIEVKIANYVVDSTRLITLVIKSDSITYNENKHRHILSVTPRNFYDYSLSCEDTTTIGHLNLTQKNNVPVYQRIKRCKKNGRNASIYNILSDTQRNEKKCGCVIGTLLRGISTTIPKQ